MNTKEEALEILKDRSPLTSRRKALRNMGLGALGLGLAPAVAQADTLTSNHNLVADLNILNFALNLEYLEAEFYLYATTGSGLEGNGVHVNGRGRLGSVSIKSNPQVVFTTPAIQQFAEEIAADEMAHVKFLRKFLGSYAVARPALDLQASFTAAAIAAGIIDTGDTFDPFADEVSFLLAAFIFEDVGVTAYRGAAPLLSNKAILSSAAGLLGTEAYHAANIRSQLYTLGSPSQIAAQTLSVQKISDLRDVLDGSLDDDQGLTLGGDANIVPTDGNGLVFARTSAQVLSVVCFGRNQKKGGFFPKGINF